MYLAEIERNRGLGWVQAAIAAGTTIIGAVQQNKAQKTALAQGKTALKIAQETRAAQTETGTLELARDRNRIIMVGVGSVALLGLGYMVTNRKRR